MPNSNGVADEFNEQLRFRALSASFGCLRRCCSSVLFICDRDHMEVTEWFRETQNCNFVTPADCHCFHGEFLGH